LSTYHHNRSRRFITLIDELYEGKCALVCSTVLEGATSPDHLFPSKQKTQISLGDGASLQQVGETLGLEEVQTQGGQPVSTLASVRELSFAFQRAASRITEMTSPRWWKQVLRADGWFH
jgi:predicted ATPase